MLSGLAVLLLAVGACGSSGGATESAAAGSGLDQSKSPILVGWLGGPGGLGLEHSNDVAKAATKYLNSTGGVHGRPLKVLTCNDEGTPESVTRCANEFVAAKVSVVGTRLTTNEAAFLTPITSAGIPFVEHAPVSQAGMGSKNVIGLSGGASEGLALAALYGREHNLKSNALILVNAPPSAAISNAVKPLYDKEGVSYKVQLVDAGTPDLTGPVTLATSGDPASLSIFGSASFCLSGLRAASSIGYRGQVFLAGCIDPKVAKDAGSTGNGAIGLAPNDLLALSPDEVKTYHTAMATYAKDVDPGTVGAASSFSTFMLIRAVLEAMPADSSYAARDVLDAFHGLRNFSYPFDGDVPLTCDGKQLRASPSVCSSKSFMVKFDNGSLKPNGYLDFSEILG
ncbi:ABC transporter substrate-binding protein [Cryptosporangium sp. NPDC051539]|uniref:ABC transporter substrate-binding protein n=1 Tax=Cryptosporangium sp. NPDC051539 TaxID=3363962 RepID=UPI0037978F7F